MVNIDTFSKDDVKELTFTEEQKELKEAGERSTVLDEACSEEH